jgi:hypothetical protein
MTISAHRYVLCMLIASGNSLVAAQNLWSASPVGTCSRLSEESPRKPIKSDEVTITAITQTYKGKHGEKFTWFWDNTPSRNPTRSLTKESANRTSCVILFLSISDQHDFKIDKNGNLPSTVKSTTSPLTNSDGTTEVIEISYRLNRSTGFYSKTPKNCKKVINKKAFEIDCKTL